VELHQLAYFVAVAEERSFTRGAARVHVVQSAVSASIRRLERELGGALFDRAGRLVVELTRRYYEQDDESVLPRSVARPRTYLRFIVAVSEGVMLCATRICGSANARKDLGAFP